ncbi:hypothetical protein [Cohnella fermenti]|uniref:Uncharacterized protein n=1 Tax=Cohnella fermenti TaxID=2565925 RepID=A0A4S4BFV9_9BACL|nr:hypothetical protein E6C55_30045 [Cohnella fermenti]
MDGTVIPASQQQWFSRNNQYAGWSNGVWNMVFAGDSQPPEGEFPGAPYTVVERTPTIREKPYLYLGENNNYEVFVPAIRENSQGISWLEGRRRDDRFRSINSISRTRTARRRQA